MPYPPMTPEEVKQFLIAAHANGLGKIRIGGGLRGGDDARVNLADVARRMNVPTSKLKHMMYTHAPRFGWNPMRPETWVHIEPGQPLDAKERVRYQDKIERLQKELSAAYREMNSANDLREQVFKLSRETISRPDIPVKKSRSSAFVPMPVLFASDFQWGEVIDAGQMDGINEYNLKIARKRYASLIDKTIDICRNHVGAPHSDTIFYLRGGDMCSGDIHQELRETNAAGSIGQVVDLVEHEAAGIAALREKFKKVVVVSVPGNHGRTTVKPMSKQYAETNYDTLSAWMLEREFRSDSGVQFYTPSSGDAIFSIYGWRFCMTHGDRIGSRGGQGFIGAAATIARGMKRVHEYYAKLGERIDYILLGHFHSYMELEWGWCNGSLPGISEYARDFRATPARASQLLFFVHPEHGVTSRWPIYLSQPMEVGESGKAFSFLEAA